MSVRARFKLPREHGAWAMLYVPFAVGTVVAKTVSLRQLLLLLSVTFVFIARESLLTWWRACNRQREDVEARRFMIGYLALAGLLGAPLVFFYQLYWLAALGLGTMLLLVANGQQAVRRKDRTIVGELMAIAGLTMTAPAAYYTSRRAFDEVALWLWLLCAFYFVSSVFYVKLRVNTINPRNEEGRKKSRLRCAAYHGFLLGALVVLVLTGSLNLFALAAFLPVIIRSFWRVARPVHRVNLRRVGWLEVIYSMVFLIFTTLTFRL
ncbi:MAG: YwiC-like family protein [Blastocatellia bacterium]